VCRVQKRTMKRTSRVTATSVERVVVREGGMIADADGSVAHVRSASNTYRSNTNGRAAHHRALAQRRAAPQRDSPPLSHAA
mgnify:CR=1